MVTQQILVLLFLVRIQVAQLKKYRIFTKDFSKFVIYKYKNIKSITNMEVKFKNTYVVSVLNPGDCDIEFQLSDYDTFEEFAKEL